MTTLRFPLPQGEGQGEGIRPRAPRALKAFLTLTLLLAATAASAQQVYWSAPESIGAGQRSAIDLVFVDGEPSGPVSLPAIDGVQVLGQPSQSTNLSIINSQRSSSTTLSYPVRAVRAGTLHLPALRVPTSAGVAVVDAIDIEVGRAAGHDDDGASTALADAVQARLTPATLTPYAGQVIDLELSLALQGNRRGEVVGAPQWHDTALAAEPWSDGEAVRTASGSAVRFRTRAAAPAQAGRVTLAPASQDIRIQTGRASDPFAGRDPFGALRRMGGADLIDSFFSGPQMADVSVESNAVQLDVQPLPAPAPADFSGAVGAFTLESTLTPEAPKTGEPVTWTLTLTGTGNWPSVALPARAVPADLRTLQPKQHREFAAGERFVGALSEDVVLVPSQPGELALAPVRFTFFNPTSGRYETAEARPPRLQVSGAPLPQAAVPAPAGEAAAAATLPVAPLAGHATGYAPLTARALTLAAAAPFALVLVAWMGLLVWRAWQADPRRVARRRRRAAHAAIEAVRRAADVDQRLAALFAWQRLAARWLGLDLAAPTAAQLRQLDDPRWTAVWADSERALYRHDHALPLGWCDAALTLLPPFETGGPGGISRPSPVATRSGRFQFLRRLVLKPAPAALLLACLTIPAHAADVSQEIPPDPPFSNGGNDWIERYNSGLAEAAAGRAGHAFGETLAAFAQAPRQEPVRSALGELAGAVPGADVRLTELAHGAQPANWLAVWQWQAVLLAALTALAAALAPIIAHAPRLAAGTGGLGAAVALTAVLALRQFGALADPQAAVVAQDVALRALPTDAAPADDAPALAAGTLVRAERDFLGWTSIRLADGGTGWVRRGELVEIYRTPNA